MSNTSGNIVPQGKNGKLSLPNLKGTYELQKLRSVHHRILQLESTGMLTQKEIAQMLGVTEVMVNYTINCDLGQQKLAYLRGQADASVINVLEQLEELSPIAVEVLEEIMLKTSAKDGDRIRAAENVLGGAGYGKREKIDVHHHGVTDEDLEKARELSKQKGRQAGLIVEAKIISENEDNGGD